MPTPKKTGLSADQWHESFQKMVPAYNELVKICTTHKTQTTQYLVASQMIASLNDLAKLHGRPGEYYFRSAPHSTHNNVRHHERS